MKSFEQYKKDVWQKHRRMFNEAKQERDYLRKLDSLGIEINFIEENYGGEIILYSPNYSVMNNFEVVEKNVNRDIYTQYQEKPELIWEECDRVFEFFKKLNSKTKIVLLDLEIDEKKINVFYHYYFSRNCGSRINYFPYGEGNMIDFFSDKGMKKNLISKLKNYIKISKDGM